MLNPPGPVHLGGISNRELMYPQNLKVKDFNGCIRNVVNDGTLYDLKSPSDKKGSAEGCRAMDKHCLPQSPCYGRAKCVPSWTGYSCLCPMGFRGDTCREGKGLGCVSALGFCTCTINIINISICSRLFTIHYI